MRKSADPANAVCKETSQQTNADPGASIPRLPVRAAGRSPRAVRRNACPMRGAPSVRLPVPGGTPAGSSFSQACFHARPPMRCCAHKASQCPDALPKSLAITEALPRLSPAHRQQWPLLRASTGSSVSLGAHPVNGSRFARRASHRTSHRISSAHIVAPRSPCTVFRKERQRPASFASGSWKDLNVTYSRPRGARA